MNNNRFSLRKYSDFSYAQKYAFTFNIMDLKYICKYVIYYQWYMIIRKRKCLYTVHYFLQECKVAAEIILFDCARFDFTLLFAIYDYC